jgi:hypothetical protein
LTTLTCACGTSLPIAYGHVAYPPTFDTCHGCGQRYSMANHGDRVTITILGVDPAAAEPLTSAAEVGNVWRTLGLAYLLQRFAERDAKAFLELWGRD